MAFVKIAADVLKIMDGGGFAFHMLRCNKCGKHKMVPFEKLGELHLRYLKGLNQPYSLVTAHTDNLIREIYPANLFRRLNIKPILKNS